MKKEKTVGGILLRIFIGVVLAIILVVVALFLISKYVVGIDIFGAYSSFKELGTTVNTETILTYQFEKNQDMVDALNEIIEFKTGETGLVTSGENTVNIDYDKLENLVFDSDLDLTDKQIACMIDSALNEYKSTAGESDLFEGLQLCQIKFSDYKESAGKFNSIKMNYVVKMSLTNFKSMMNSFPLSLFKNLLPNELYIQSTLTITKDNNRAWSYSTKAENTTINNLDVEKTTKLISSISGIIGAGNADDLGLSIGGIITDLMIGNKESLGFASGLLNAEDFTFKRYNNTNYFSIKFDF